jgi:membrane-associated phospholipid phosphatase
MKGNPLSQKLVPKKLNRLGVITKQPVIWILVSAAMATVGGSKGRQAALRGYVCYLLGAAAGNLPKPLFGRAQPRHRRPRRPQVIRGAFPSGHAAAEVAYVFGASLEAPIAFVPLGTMALLAHLSLIKAGQHYISDTLVGGTIGLAVVALTAKAWPPQTNFPMVGSIAYRGSVTEWHDIAARLTGK